jgi:methionyl-tRNA synthetase
MLMEHGDFVIPDNVPANEFLNLEGNKLSTSRNYAVWLDDYLKKFDPDSLRYVLASNLPEARDTDFSWKDFQARHNNELADILGNFINRTVTFAHRYFDGKVPEAGAFDELDEKLVSALKTAPEKLGGYIDKYQFKTYVKEFMDLSRFANKYFNDKEPWKTRKDNPEVCATTIHLCLQTVCSLSILAEPVIPFSSRKIWNMLDLDDEPRWQDASRSLMPGGKSLKKAEIVFRKIEDAEIQAEIDVLKSALEQKTEATAAEESVLLVPIESFQELDLRVAEIINAETVKKADRLLRLDVQVGSESRQIVAGIAKFYDPGTLPGKKIIIVANLEPAKIRGIESQGMLLAAKSGDNLTLLTIMDDAFPSGAQIA